MPGFPAARLTDMHTCPMCMGATLPIVGVGAPTVLIGGLPAARMTDFCACIAPIPVPVDPIIMGSPVVLISGMPATFMGAATAKGGVLLPPCCPTVLIGMAPMPVMVTPSMSVIVPSVPDAPQGPLAPPAPIPKREPSPVCMALFKDASELKAARNDAMLASAAYGDANDPLPAGTRRATVEDLQKIGLHDGENDMTRMPDSDFRSEVFVQQDPLTGEDTYVVGFKGSTFPPWKSPEDWLTNLQQGMGRETPYYNRAMAMAKRANIAAPGKVRYVGHSLGGGMASAAAAVSGAEARTFNAAGLNAATVARQGAELTDAAHVQAYNVQGEILTRLQQAPGMSKAVGKSIPLPRVGSSSIFDKVAGFIGGVLGAISGPLGALLGGAALEEVVESGRMHMMSEMLSSIDAKAAKVAQAQVDNGC